MRGGLAREWSPIRSDHPSGGNAAERTLARLKLAQPIVSNSWETENEQLNRSPRADQPPRIGRRCIIGRCTTGSRFVVCGRSRRGVCEPRRQTRQGVQPASWVSALALQAATYAAPIVAMYNLRDSTSVGPHAKVPPNDIWRIEHIASPEVAAQAGYVTPNVNVIYGFGFMDLGQQPIILSAPDSEGRYYMVEICDMWANAFAYVGGMATGYKGGTFALVGPGWQGKLPAGVKRIDCPTRWVELAAARAREKCSRSVRCPESAAWHNGARPRATQRRPGARRGRLQLRYAEDQSQGGLKPDAVPRPAAILGDFRRGHEREPAAAQRDRSGAAAVQVSRHRAGSAVETRKRESAHSERDEIGIPANRPDDDAAYCPSWA